jgi:hypothetical protein
MLRLFRRTCQRNCDDVFELGSEACTNLSGLRSSKPIMRLVHSPAMRGTESVRRYLRDMGAIRGMGMRMIIARTKSDVAKGANGEVTGEGNEKKAHTSLAQYDYDDYDDYEEPTTAGGKVAMYTRMMLQLAMLAAFAGCTYITFQELFPGRMSPNRMYGDAFELLKTNAELQRMIGEEMSAFGRSAGRRHFDSRAYIDDYGGNRCRIRFNVRGSRGQVMVWAEMADTFADSSEFAYLIVQDRRTGQVLTVQDNRAKIDEMASAGQLVVHESFLTKAMKLMGGGAGEGPPAAPAN